MLLKEKTKTKSRGAPVSKRGGLSTLRKGPTKTKGGQTAAGGSVVLTWSSEKNRILNLTREERRKVYKGLIRSQKY